MLRSLSIFLIFLMSIAAMCDKNTDSAISENDSTQKEYRSEMKKGEFAYKILSELNSTDNNVMLSPVSIRYLLYMAASSTEGKTQDEITAFLGLDSSGFNKMSEDIKKEIARLNQSDSTFKSVLKNALFYDMNKVEIKEGYINTLQSNYRAEVKELNFESEKESVKMINKWASDATQKHIDKVLDQINDEEFLFLLNALYVKADWVHAFSEEQTVKGTFFQSDEKSFPTVFMQKTKTMKAYLSDDVKIAQLPLAGNKINATFIMPLNESIDSFSENLTPEKINQYEDLLSQEHINLKLPKMKMRYHVELNETMKKLGLRDVFKPESNFKTMTSSSDKVYMSRLLHDTYFEMDEKGIEGAAVTTAGMGITSLPERIFFDHPFIISIKMKNTDTQLFLGSITNPNPER